MAFIPSSALQISSFLSRTTTPELSFVAVVKNVSHHSVNPRKRSALLQKDRVATCAVDGPVPSPSTIPASSEVDENSPKLTPGFANSLKFEDRQLSYDYIPGSTPTILFLPGYYFSRWRQQKSNALELFAKRRGQAIVVEEYLGTGHSGDFAKDGTLSQWVKDTCTLLDCIDGPVVLVGAGVGGWIMLHVAIQRSDRVIGLVGVNPSVDFTHDLIEPALTLEQRKTIDAEGSVEIQWGYCNYPISKALLEDANQWLVLNRGPRSLPITCPVRLLQGLNDEEIPSDRILQLVDTLETDNCVVSLIKSGDHLLEDESNMKRMMNEICDISDNYYEFDLTSPASG